MKPEELDYFSWYTEGKLSLLLAFERLMCIENFKKKDTIFFLSELRSKRTKSPKYLASCMAFRINMLHMSSLSLRVCRMWGEVIWILDWDIDDYGDSILACMGLEYTFLPSFHTLPLATWLSSLSNILIEWLKIEEGLFCIVVI